MTSPDRPDRPDRSDQPDQAIRSDQPVRSEGSARSERPDRVDRSASDDIADAMYDVPVETPVEASVGAPVDSPSTAPRETLSSGPGLLPTEDSESWRRRWRDIQAGFVDNPEESVREAQELLGEVARALVDSVTGRQKAGAVDTDTEGLRLTFQRYRDLFDTLTNA